MGYAGVAKLEGWIWSYPKNLYNKNTLTSVVSPFTSRIEIKFNITYETFIFAKRSFATVFNCRFVHSST